MKPTAVPSPQSTAGRPRPLERLEAEIVELASQLTAASARLTRLIGEFDAAEGWREWGMRSTAHWLSWHCGMGLGAAREQVRVARALRSLPVIAGDYAAGLLSYAKVRALTRFATAASDAELAIIARHSTGAQIEQLARAARRPRTGDEVRDQHAAAYLKFSVTDDGSVVGSFRLPPAEGAEFVRAIEAGAGRLPDYASDGDAAERVEQKLKRVTPRGYAWVLAAMTRQFLDALLTKATPEQAERYQLMIHATAEQLARPDDADDTTADRDAATLPDGVRLHTSTLRRLTCDCPVTSIVEDADGAALHVGRRSRRVGRKLRRAVDVRDRGRCRAPGCTQRATQIHHVRHWANGGTTCLRNLISLCDAHHWLVHEGGFTIVPRSPGRWALLGPNGVVVEPEPPILRPAKDLPPDPTVTPDAVRGHWGGTPMGRYALDVILTSIGAFEPRDCARQDVSAETLSRAAA
jgi:hypothetical protein